MLRFLALAFTLHVAACASMPPVRSDLTGTWRFMSVDGRTIEKPFYIRYYPDGTAASWPAPEGISHGRYSIEGGILTLDTDSGDLDPKARFQIKADRLSMTNEEGNRLVYRRVLPTLRPGARERPSEPSSAPPNLSESAVLKLAAEAAEKAKIDLTRYRAPTVSSATVRKDGRWWVHYAGRQAMPGNHFSVSIDDGTKRAGVHRGK